MFAAAFFFVPFFGIPSSIYYIFSVKFLDIFLLMY